MGTIPPLPGDNLYLTVRQWVKLCLSNSTLASLADSREQEAVTNRLMAGLDDRSRILLEALDRRYDEGELTVLSNQIKRVLMGEPVQRVVGWTDFRGLRIGCEGEVLIPRPETEEVVGWFLEGMASFEASAKLQAPVRVLDIGTGSGCIAISIKRERPNWEVMAIDISESALEQAKANAKDLNTEVTFIQLDALHGSACEGLGSFHGIVSNPPYIPDSERLEDHVLYHEPREALFVPASDPLIFYRSLIRFAANVLVPGGCMVAECHSEFAGAVTDCWQLDGATLECLTDLQGAERAVRLLCSQT